MKLKSILILAVVFMLSACGKPDNSSLPKTEGNQSRGYPNADTSSGDTSGDTSNDNQSTNGDGSNDNGNSKGVYEPFDPFDNFNQTSPVNPSNPLKMK